MGRTSEHTHTVRIQDITTFELVRTRNGDDIFVSLVVSIVGREGTVRHTWTLKNGVPDASQAMDIQGLVSRYVVMGLLRSTGVQQCMEFLKE